MALIPRSIIGRVLLGVYVLACAGMLLFAWVQQDIHDMPEAFFWLMNFFTFPMGYAAAMVLGVISFALMGTSANGTYHPFWDVVPVWIALAAAGYAQWFILVPWLWRKIVKKESHLTTRWSGP